MTEEEKQQAIAQLARGIVLDHLFDGIEFVAVYEDEEVIELSEKLDDEDLFSKVYTEAHKTLNQVLEKFKAENNG